MKYWCLYLFLYVSAWDISYSLENADEKILWDYGKHYSAGWKIFIALLCFSVVLNALSLYLIIFPLRSRSNNMMTLIFYLNFIDLIEAVGCLLYCSINMHYMEIFGHEKSCESQALFVMIIVLWEAWILALIAYVLERNVCGGVEINDKQIFKYFIGVGIISVALSLCGLYLPYGGYHLYSSGTYCLVNMSTIIGGLSWSLGVMIPLVIMIQRYYRIWVRTANAQSMLKMRGIDAKAKARYYHSAKKMAVYIITFFLCVSVTVGCIIYEGVTHLYVPPIVDIISGSLLHLDTILNPLLFFMMNDDAKEAFYLCILHPILICFRIIKQEKILPTKIKRKSDPQQQQNSLFIKGNSRRSMLCRNPSQEVMKYLSNWKTWIQDENLCEIFRCWCEANFVGENYLFYKEAIAHQNICKEIGMKLLQCMKQRLETNEEFPDELMLEWRRIFDITKNMYDLYIRVPTAPLEINIPGVTRRKIEVCLLTIGNKRDTLNDGKDQPIIGYKPESSAKMSAIMGVSLITIPLFPDIWLLPVEDAKDILDMLSKVFETALSIVEKLISSDVFPRFQRSAVYQKASLEFDVSNIKMNNSKSFRCVDTGGVDFTMV